MDIPANVQQDYERWISKGFKLIHTPASRQEIISTVQQAKNPVEGCAQATVIIITKLDEVSRQAGIEVNDAIKLQSAQVFIGDINKISKANLNEKHLKASLTLAIQLYTKQEIDAGRMDPNELQRQVEELAGSLSQEDKDSVDKDFNDVSEVGQELGYEQEQPKQPSMLGGQQ